MQPDTRRKLDSVPALLEDEFPGLTHDAAVQTVETISGAMLARANRWTSTGTKSSIVARERILDAGRVNAPVS